MKANHTPSEQQFRIQIQRKLQEAECAPPPPVWEKLETHLNAKRKKRVGLFWWTGIAASLLILSLGGWYFTQKGELNQAESTSTALNPVWLHAQPASKIKKRGTTNKILKQNPDEIKPSNPAPTFAKPVAKPVLFLPRQNAHAALTGVRNMEDDQPQLILLPAFSANLNNAVSLQIDTNLKTAIQLPLLQPENQDLPPVSNRKVYGIGIGKYKLKISLASKE